MRAALHHVRALLALVVLALVVHAPAQAHKPSDSYLTITVAEGAVTGRWDIALRDLDFAIGLDADGDGAITWGEVRARHAEIAAYALARLSIRADGADAPAGAGAAVQSCTIDVGAQAIDDHTDGSYSVLPLTIHCPQLPKRLTIGYRLFADLDPQHRGLLNLQAGGVARSAVLGPQAPVQSFDLNEASRLRQFLDYLRDGVWHIWIGFDHILFLLSLLLPAVLVWGGRQWRGAQTFGAAFWSVVRVVTAFTAAHSITLTLATLGYVSLPSRWVESAIAASVVLAALNNVWPVFHGRRWMVAFGFGLVHGFGFASVLVDLGLPRDALALALVGFNLGVEGGQLAIVAVFLPLAYSLRRSWFYRRLVMVGGSLVIALLAAVWLCERLFMFKVLPF
ncbi:MAG: HupE/UreJ family protein [Bacteriovorax sp.]|nr:HupE/UreJ family protein [Rhizobacter sp.]